MNAIKRFLGLESSTSTPFNPATEYEGPPPPYETLESPDAKVYVTWDPMNPPSRPTEPGWTRFVCVSDTHCQIIPVPEGDVFIHAGDLTHSGRFAEFEPTISWIRALPHGRKVVIAGNHDLTLDRDSYPGRGSRWHLFGSEDPTQIRGLLTPDESFTYLEYSSKDLEINGKTWKLFGSPGTPWFRGAFHYKRGEQALDIAARIPDSADVVITHGPPHDILDKTMGGVGVGCYALAARLEEIRPALSIFGHIHKDRGAIIKQWDDDGSGRRKSTVYVNAATQVNGKKYQPSHMSDGQGSYTEFFQPIIVDLRN